MINNRAGFTGLLGVINPKWFSINHHSLPKESANIQVPDGESENTEIPQYRGDWIQGSTYHKLYVSVMFIVWTPLNKHIWRLQTLIQSPPHHLFTHTHTHTHTQTEFSFPSAFIYKMGLSALRLEPDWPPALWGCRGLFGRMWTQHPVCHRRGWPKTYWILGAEPGALGQSGRLRLSHVGLELRHLQELKWGVLSTEDSSHPWVFGVEMGLGGWGHSAV